MATAAANEVMARRQREGTGPVARRGGGRRRTRNLHPAAAAEEKDSASAEGIVGVIHGAVRSVAHDPPSGRGCASGTSTCGLKWVCLAVGGTRKYDRGKQ